MAAAGNAILCTAATIACTMLFSAGMPAIAEEPLPMVYTLRELVGAGAWVQYLFCDRSGCNAQHGHLHYLRYV